MECCDCFQNFLFNIIEWLVMEMINNLVILPGLTIVGKVALPTKNAGKKRGHRMTLINVGAVIQPSEMKGKIEKEISPQRLRVKVTCNSIGCRIVKRVTGNVNCHSYSVIKFHDLMVDWRKLVRVSRTHG